MSIQTDLEAITDPFEVAIRALVEITHGLGPDHTPDPDLALEGLRSNLIANIALARIRAIGEEAGQ